MSALLFSAASYTIPYLTDISRLGTRQFRPQIGKRPARALLLGAVEEIFVVGRAQVTGIAVTEGRDERGENVTSGGIRRLFLIVV